MFAIHPDFLEYLDRSSKRESVIWEANMSILNCFSKKFNGDHNRLVFAEYHGMGMFELGFEFDRRGWLNREDPVAVRFWCADAQLMRHERVLSQLNPDGSLPATAFLGDAIAHMQKQAELSPRCRKDAIHAYRILRTENILIPPAELKRMLDDIPHH